MQPRRKPKPEPKEESDEEPEEVNEGEGVKITMGPIGRKKKKGAKKNIIKKDKDMDNLDFLKKLV